MKFKAPNGEVIEVTDKNLVSMLEREGFKEVKEKGKKEEQSNE